MYQTLFFKKLRQGRDKDTLLTKLPMAKVCTGYEKKVLRMRTEVQGRLPQKEQLSWVLKDRVRVRVHQWTRKRKALQVGK